VEDAVSLCPLLNEPRHVNWIDAKDIASGIHVSLKVSHVGANQLVRDGQPRLW
jgi:hypothetical protein